MKIGRLVIAYLKYTITKHNAEICNNLVIDSKYRPHRDIPYLDDNDEHHKFDLYFAPKDRKNTLIIDIHGGSYIFGHRKENYTFGTVFLDAGFDFIATDYVANNGKMSTRELIDQNIQCILYIVNHKKELGLDDDKKIIIMGDSAGGHMALTIAELFLDKGYQKELGYDLPNINLKAVLVNCPVFNYEDIGFDMVNKGGLKRLFGPNALDKDERRKICPKTHINSLIVPLFASTCKNDFLRKNESLKLKEMMENKNTKFTFLDLDIDDPSVGHVHNILDINHEAGKKVNEAMIKFINENI